MNDKTGIECDYCGEVEFMVYEFIFKNDVDKRTYFLCQNCKDILNSVKTGRLVKV
jgi:hypothetical protein